MDRHNSVESLNEVIHKERSKENTEDKRPIVNSLLDSSSIVQGITPVNSLPEQLAEHQSRQKSIAKSKLIDADRLRKQTRNVEIDASLRGWVLEGLVDSAYVGWVAKCCHVLGLELVNSLALNARNGKSPQRLFSSLLKGNMNLKAKQEYYNTSEL